LAGLGENGARGWDETLAQPRKGAMLSVVIPCYNEAQTLAASWPRLARATLTWPEPCEFIFVDDGSTDGTWECIRQLAETDLRVRGVRLWENVGQQWAIGVGLAHAQGEAVVVLDADLQDPPELVPRLVAEWQRGADLVVAVRRARAGEAWWKGWAARLVYRMLWRWSTGRTLPDAGDCALMDKKVVRWLLQWRTGRPFWRGMRELGPFRRAYVEYDREGRLAGRSHYSLGRLCQLAWDGILGLTRGPVIMAGWLAGVCGVVVATIVCMVLMGTMEPMHAILALGMCAISGQLMLACQYGWRLLRYLEMPIEAWVVEYAGAAAQSDSAQQPESHVGLTANIVAS